MTVADLVCECCDRFSVNPEFQLADRHLVWLEVCRIVANVACIAPEELLSETNFIRDLGF